MSNQNNNGSDIGMAVGLIAAVIFAMGLLVFLILAFVAFLYTIFCLMAWNKPLRLGKSVIEPDEARWFIKRGLIGAGALPAFVLLMGMFSPTGLHPDAMLWSVLAGYIGGSVGVEIWIQTEAQKQAELNATILPPQVPPSAPPRTIAPPQESRPPFQYGEWDDEELRR
jgi:hypothetical protein